MTQLNLISFGSFIAGHLFHKEDKMNKNKNKIKGVWQTAKGKVKVGVGHAIGNIKMEAEGVSDQIKGKVNRSIGKAKAALDKK